MEFDGAIYDEVDCFEGGRVYLDANGIAQDGKKHAHWITAVWDCGMTRNKCRALWVYRTDLPCERFDILEDDAVYCEGIIFSLEDLKKEGAKEVRKEISSKLFEDIAEGKVDFVIAEDVDDIKTGDCIVLMDVNGNDKYDPLVREVRYVLRYEDAPKGLEKGYCVIGFFWA